MSSGRYGDGGYAYPVPGYTDQPVQQYPVQQPTNYAPVPGMSVRDFYAGQALAGMVSHPGFDLLFNIGEIDEDRIGERCYALADQLLKHK